MTSIRYGNTPTRRRHTIIAFIVVAALVLAAAVVWLLWVILGHTTGPTINATDAANNVIDATHVSVSITVQAKAGTKVSCGLQAQDQDMNVVGYLVVHLGRVPSTPVQLTRTLRTYEAAVVGSLDQCWVG